VELLPVEEQETVLRRQNWRHRCVGRRIGNERVHRLALVRHEGRDVDECRHVGIVSNPGDHRSAVGMADEDHRLVLGVDDHLGRRHVAFERKRWILDDRNVVAVLP
jgi:hypothetical protein